MHSANDDDFYINLGTKVSSSDLMPIKLHYNLSKFLRLHDSNESLRHKIANADEFTQLLDSKVYIDTSDPKYSHIYQGIDTIVNHVVLELTKLDSFFAHVKLRQTGSSMSGVKVGMPHEADYVMELPEDKRLKTGESFDKETLFTLVGRIVADQAVELTKGLANWVIHGVTKYDKTGGVCLVMQCRSTANNPSLEEVGVTVDLIPGYIEKAIPENDVLNKKAQAFLPYSLEKYAEKKKIYRLIYTSKCDTGFIENEIMKQLPKDTKRAFRVAKFFLSHIASPLIPFKEIECLGKKTRLRLYGRKPCISSYQLRVLFLHLVLELHDTEAEQRIKGGLLSLCLLDMLEYCMENSFWNDVFYLDHPLMTNHTLSIHAFPSYLIKRIKCFIEKDNTVHVVNELCLLNSKVHI